MLASAIHELAASRASQLVATAYFEKTVQIWNTHSLKLVNEFPTNFRAGARNLALTPDGSILITGRSTTSGKVVAYATSTGEQLWERRFVYPSVMQVDPSGETVSLTTNQRSVVRLDVHTGSDVEVIRRVEKRFLGPKQKFYPPLRERKLRTRSIRMAADSVSQEVVSEYSTRCFLQTLFA